jgi:diphosphomevalonate decarboxylase
MPDLSATAIAHPNIALIKYWGNRIDPLRLPSNGSISMNLDGLESRTMVAFSPDLETDQFVLNGFAASGPDLHRVSAFLDIVRQKAGSSLHAVVESRNNFPIGAGVASSAAAFAALSLASSKAIGLELNEMELSRLARRGSGSACRSVPGGYVEWLPGRGDSDSYAISIASSDYWNLVDAIVVISTSPKAVGSTEGHSLARSSLFQNTRVADTNRRLELCRQAILSCDFDALASVIELDSNMMHAVMMTSQPTLLYFMPATITTMQAVMHWRKNGLPVCYTLDAGPNVHVLCPAESAKAVSLRLEQLPGIHQVLLAHPGGPAHLI